MPPLDDHIKKELDAHLVKIEGLLAADALTLVGPILSGLEMVVREVLDKFSSKRDRLAIILDTGGGILEVTERIVNTIRSFYKEVYFLIPNRAMSAGTVFVMSGDKIFMDYFSCLGPIDPQIEKNDVLVPALSYLHKFEELNKKAVNGQLTSAEYALLTKLDLGELDQFEQAKNLSIDLIVEWLSTYKFKNWQFTETRHETVTEDMKKVRARKIAEDLNDYPTWHSHGRGINMKTLQDTLKLKIDDFSSVPDMDVEIKKYFNLLMDYLNRNQSKFFWHTREVFG